MALNFAGRIPKLKHLPVLDGSHFKSAMGILASSIIYSVTMISSSYAFGHASCGSDMPYNLQMYTKLSKTIFFAQVLNVGATGRIKVDKRDTALYSNITIRVEKILRSDARPINTGDTIELTAIDDAREPASRLLDEADRGGFILFYWDNDRYTLSGDDKKDPAIARRILSSISFAKTNVTKAVSFPCQHEIIDKTFGVPALEKQLSGYIKAQRGQ